jgi:hypothetical protein
MDIKKVSPAANKNKILAFTGFVGSIAFNAGPRKGELLKKCCIAMNIKNWGTEEVVLDSLQFMLSGERWAFFPNSSSVFAGKKIAPGGMFNTQIPICPDLIDRVDELVAIAILDRSGVVYSLEEDDFNEIIAELKQKKFLNP